MAWVKYRRTGSSRPATSAASKRVMRPTYNQFCLLFWRVAVRALLGQAPEHLRQLVAVARPEHVVRRRIELVGVHQREPLDQRQREPERALEAPARGEVLAEELARASVQGADDPALDRCELLAQVVVGPRGDPQ